MKKIIITLLSLTIFLFSNETKEENLNNKLLLLNKYIKILNIVENNYIDKLKFEEIIDKSIEGLALKLDKHSKFLKDDNLKEFNKNLNNYFGIGITTEFINKKLIVLEVINEELRKKGMKRGNLITHINGKKIEDLKLEEVSKEFKGKLGDTKNLTFVDNDSNTLNINIVIENIINNNIIYFVKENYSYIKIRQFFYDTSKTFKDFLNKNKDKNIIIDLRGNPGGLFEESIEMTDYFLNDEVIVTQKSRDPKFNKTFIATKDTTIYNNKVIVLVDEKTASSSEIFAGTLQNYNKAILIGETTYGKGTIQLLIPLNKSKTEAIKITNSEYFISNNIKINNKGLEPDILLKNDIEIFSEKDKILDFAIKIVNKKDKIY